MHLSAFLGDEHRKCDDHFADMDTAMHRGDWKTAGDALAAFTAATLHHFHVEEDIVFPELERATGQVGGPTQVMRMEHADMRELLDELQRAILELDRAQATGIGETLLMLLQQHNAKEERILYPMLDRLLGPMTDELLERIESAHQISA